MKIKLSFTQTAKKQGKNKCRDGEQGNWELSSGYFKFEMLMKHLSEDFKSATKIPKSGFQGEVQAKERNLKVMSQTDRTESDSIRGKHLQNDLLGTELGLGTY